MLNKFIEKYLSGHISIGNLTVFGRNAMHWGVMYRTNKYGFICFRLPFTCYGRWIPLYFYLSPNATPWAATFMLGKKHDRRDWALARVRKYKFGHGFNTDDYREQLYKINQTIGN